MINYFEKRKHQDLQRDGIIIVKPLNLHANFVLNITTHIINP